MNLKRLVQSVKFRLTLWYAFVLTVLLSVFSFLMYEELSRVLYHDADKNLTIEAETIADSLESHLNRNGRLLAGPKLIEAIKKWEKNTRRISRSTLIIRLIGFDRTILISNLKKWEREIIFPDFERDSVFMEKGASLETIHFNEKPIRLYYRRVQNRGHPILVIQCGTPLYEVKIILDRLGFIMLLSIPGAVVSACLAGWFLAKRFFHPIDLMIREARQITAAYLQGRLPRSRTGDELDRLAETINEMMDRIESSTRAVQDFSSDVSHEFKTPLAIIRGEIDLALRKTRSPEALVETLRVIEGEVNELIRLVDDLMLLVRSDAKQLHFQKEAVSLKQILEHVRDRFQDRAQTKNISLASELSAEGEVLGDPIYLKRLFSNLLDNAIKFTPEGGTIGLNLSSQNGWVQVTVSDTGVGIEPQLQAKVFSRFYRTDQARSHEGSGLGLNIAKAICDAHGGAIQIESRPGQGTSVIVTFPHF